MSCRHIGRVELFSCILAVTMALEGSGWSQPYPGCFTLRKGPKYPLYRRLVGPQSWSEWVWKISPLLGFEPQTIQPVACCCTSYAILAFLFMGARPLYSAYFKFWWIYIFVYIHCSIVGLVLRCARIHHKLHSL